jgi:hypothetical protein
MNSQQQAFTVAILREVEKKAGLTNEQIATIAGDERRVKRLL